MNINVIKAQKYLNQELLPKFGDIVLKNYGYQLPISYDTAWQWMVKSSCSIVDNNKV